MQADLDAVKRRPDREADHVAAVAFCTDKFMETSLHVAAFSLLRNLRSDYNARLYFLLERFSAADIECLRRTLDSAGHPYTMKLLQADGSHAFAGFPRLHGNLAPYYRLLLPDLVDEDRLLYLDSDTRVDIDISPLFEHDMGQYPAGFVVSSTVDFALDREFQFSIGRSPDQPAFNSGVCLFNIVEWRRQNCSERVRSFGAAHKKGLISHDQSLLNALFADDCYRLDARYNINMGGTFGPHAQPPSGILHFVGNPKPWDLGATLVLPYARPWFDDLRRTAIPLRKRLSWLNLRSWQRLPKTVGGYRRILRVRLRGTRTAPSM